MFDITVYPLSFNAGRELYEIPGLLVMAAPRKAARMRGQDQLIISMKLLTTTAGNGGTGAANFSPAQQTEMLNRLAETYYAFSGSVTAGLRAVTARLNEFLLSRNLKASQEGQTVGLLNLAVIHGSSLIVAHAGPTHTFVLGKDTVQHFDDSLPAGGAGRGLGLSRLAVPRFYQAAVDTMDLLIFCSDPPPSWTTRALANSPQLPFDHLRRRLLSEAAGDLQAAVLRLQPGKGQVTFYKPGDRVQGEPPAPRGERPARGSIYSASASQNLTAAPGDASVSPDVSAPASAAPAPVPPFTTVQPEPVAPQRPVSETNPQRVEDSPLQSQGSEPPRESQPPAEIPQESTVPLSETPAEPSITHPAVFLGGAGSETAKPIPQAELASLPPRPRPRPTRQLEETAQPAAVTAAPRQQGRMTHTGQPARQSRPTRQLEPKPPRENTFAKSVAGAGQGVREAWLRGAPGRAKFSGTISSASRKVLPKRYDPEGREIPLFNFSSGTMLAIAIVVPLIVVAVATAVYFQAGRSEQFQAFFLQAQQYAMTAGQQTDPLQQRESWTRTYELVRKAEQYGSSSESAALRKQAQEALDNIEGLVRLDYLPAVRGGFPAGVNITRIVATLNDVYLLDSSQGRILRLYRTAAGYEVDAKFTCGGGQVGNIVVDPLVDLAPMAPSNDLGATVVGIDGKGNLVYCSPSMDGFVSKPLVLPDTGSWGKITGIYLYGERLYVLDPSGNGVYYFDGARGVFEQGPHFYFGNQIPRLGDVVDLTVDQEFLYLLHSDGQMTVCEGGGYSLAPTNCQDTPYGDSRPGFEPSPLTFQGAAFTQIQATQPPDPSLFVLDSANHSIYHLSLRRLNLQRQYRPKMDTDFPVPNGPATAFAIAPNRRALLAFENEIFFAPLP